MIKVILVQNQTKELEKLLNDEWQIVNSMGTPKTGLIIILKK